MSSLDVEDAATAYALAKSGFFVTNKHHSIMKQYIIIRHSEYYSPEVDKEFDNYEDAINYVKLASIGDPDHTYEVFEKRV